MYKIYMQDSIINNFGRKLKELRRLHNLTQEELAVKINTTQANICRWEQGYFPKDRKVLNQISEFFNMEEKFLFLDDDNSKDLFLFKKNMSRRLTAQRINSVRKKLKEMEKEIELLVQFLNDIM